MPEQHVGELIEWRQPLPPELTDPTRSGTAGQPLHRCTSKPVQAFLQQVGFHHAPVDPEQFTVAPSSECW